MAENVVCNTDSENWGFKNAFLNALLILWVTNTVLGAHKINSALRNALLILWVTNTVLGAPGTPIVMESKLTVVKDAPLLEPPFKPT